MMEFCKSKVAPWITEGLEEVKTDENKGRQFGVDAGVRMGK